MKTMIKMEETSEGLEMSINKNISNLAIYTAFIGLMDVMIEQGNQGNIKNFLTKAYAEANNAKDKTVS